MDFETIRELAKHHKQSFGRILKCEMYKLEGGRLLTITRLHDDFHDMNLAILLSDSYRIEEIAGKMDRIPQPCCETKPLEMLSSLKGIAVLERGGLKKVKERIPRNMSCTHIYEMLESTFRSIFVGSYSILGQKWDGVLNLEMEENRQLGIQSPVLSRHLFRLQPRVGRPGDSRARPEEGRGGPSEDGGDRGGQAGRVTLVHRLANTPARSERKFHGL